MPDFSLTVETTSNSNILGLIQFLMPAARECQLIATFLGLPVEASNRDFGRIVISRISSIGATNWDTLVPFELDPSKAASAISSTTATIEATANGQLGTEADAAMFEVPLGWYDWEKYGIMSGIAQGFCMKRPTAPSGARVVTASLFWRE